jgi:dTDP-4-amino-4,6-dideoxygalactose transaminase
VADPSILQVPFLGLGQDHALVREDAMRRIERVLDSQSFVLGRETDELEAAIAGVAGARHAIACSSGSDAILLVLKALGIGSGDAVVVPAFTFFATAGAVAMAGATPCFVDVDPTTLCVGSQQLEQALGKSLEARDNFLIDARSGLAVKAVIPVHLYGWVADVRGIESFLAPFAGPPAVIEDAAQAIGADAEGARVGSLGMAGCFSFYPTKNLGGAGDGGAVTTNDDALAVCLRKLRTHGAEGGAYLHTHAGMNARMAEVQAAYLNAKLAHLARWNDRRRQIADRYRRALSSLADAGVLELPAVGAGQVYHQFTIRIGRDRDALVSAAGNAGVDVRVFYPIPLHLQPCFSDLGYTVGSFPASERAAATVLSLPIYPSLSDAEIDTVVGVLRVALGEAR